MRNLVLSVKDSLLFKRTSLFLAVHRLSPFKLWSTIFQGRFATNSDILEAPSSTHIKRKWRLPHCVLHTSYVVEQLYYFLTSTKCSRGDLLNSRLPMILPENDICKFVGFSAVRTGSAPVKMYGSPGHFEEFVQTLDDDDKSYMYSRFTDKVMVAGGTSAMFGNIRQMAEPNACKFTYDDMIEAINQRKHYFKLPHLGSLKNYELHGVRVNPEAYSGFVTSMCSGQLRRASHQFSEVIAKLFFKRIKKKRVNSLDLWKFGTRPKANKLVSEDKPLKARPIALCDDVLVKVGSITSQRIIDRLKFMDYSEIFIGKALTSTDMNYIKEQLVRDDVLYASPDWSQYDNYLYEEVMVTACSLLQQCFDDDVEVRNYFHYITSSVVDKHIIIEPGAIYKLMKGLPSGHPFTALVNTVACWILWTTIFYKCSILSGIPLDER